ncbi:MAG: CopG family transcriptional regulator [Acidobacteriota bacterium]|nr:CopG family transcriptional regulator [Acidobacteriota bacterium]
MVRTQLYLDEQIHARLRDLARKQGRTLSELVREALERAYGTGGTDERLRTLRGVEGLWRGRRDIGKADAYVRRLRSDTRRSRRKKS